VSGIFGGAFPVPPFQSWPRLNFLSRLLLDIKRGMDSLLQFSRAHLGRLGFLCLQRPCYYSFSVSAGIGAAGRHLLCLRRKSCHTRKTKTWCEHMALFMKSQDPPCPLRKA
jgi:hypothetical protein